MQSGEIKCPTGRKFGVPCPCDEFSISARLTPIRGATLIIVPAGGVSHWVKHVRTWLKKSGYPWILRHAYRDTKLNGIIPKFCKDDLKYLWNYDGKSSEVKFHQDASRMVVITTIGCYRGHLSDFGATYKMARATKGGLPAEKIKIDPILFWGRVCVDEAHRENQRGASTIKLCRNLIECPAKNLITGTPFEQGPGKMAEWIGTGYHDHLKRAWVRQRKYRPPWPRAEAISNDLSCCTREQLLETHKEHLKLVENKIPPGERDGRTNFHISQLQRILHTLLIQRGPNSRLFGELLTTIPHHHHRRVPVYHDEAHLKAINEAAVRAEVAAKQAHAQVVDDWKKNPRRTGEEPLLSAQTYLAKSHTARCLSTTPHLHFMPATRNLKYTVDECYANGWLQVESGKLYELKRANSPYERHLRELTADHNAAKFAYIKQRIAAWDANEPCVFLAHSPVSALILYWVRCPDLTCPHDWIDTD